ncbi:MAG: DCC1-like thiol-disulfide oxidoreductase family protein [Pseudomonadota bacterium]
MGDPVALRNDGGAAPRRSDGPVVLYDGVCGLCNRTVAFVLRRDRRHQFRFATLQGTFGAAALARHGLRTDGDPASIVLLESPGTPSERARVRSDAVLAIVAALGGPWRLVSLLRILPRVLRDAAYELVARIRYRVFGRFDTCPVPSPTNQSQFID